MSGDEENQAAAERDKLTVRKEIVEKLLNSSIEAQQRADRMADENAKLIDALNNRGGGGRVFSIGRMAYGLRDATRPVLFRTYG